MGLLQYQLLIKCNFFIVFCFLIQPDIFGQENDYREKINLKIDHAREMEESNRDSSILIFEECITSIYAQNDSLSAQYLSYELSTIYANGGHYYQAYDLLWSLLVQINHTGDSFLKAYIFAELGHLYLIFDQYESSLQYFKKVEDIYQNAVENNQTKLSELGISYYNQVLVFKEMKMFDSTQFYVARYEHIADSLGHDALKRVYLESEKGHVLALKGKLNEAEAILQSTAHTMIESDGIYKGQLIKIFKYLGDVYLLKLDKVLAVKYYSQCVNVSNKQKKFVETKIEALEELAKIYASQGKFRLAYRTNKEYNQLSNQLFGSKSNQNKKLFEIKDQYKKAQELHEKEINQQKIVILEQDREVYRLRNIIYSISILLLLILALVFFIYQRKRHHYSTKLLEEQKRLEAKKAKEILEIKNKELTTTALKLVSKDKLIINIKEQLKFVKEKTKERARVERLIATVNAESKKNWQEFELRFSAVNENFYTQLKANYSSLTSNDLKICAFIKLEMASKDIANLMGISLESFHTSRYRIRKKMGLSGDLDLDGVIQGL